MAKDPSFVVLTGMQELDSALKEFPDNLRKKYIRKALKQITNEVSKDAQSRAPRKGQGRIAEAIKVVPMKRTRKHKGVIGLAVSVGSGWFRGDTFFAGFLEFGTSPRKTRTGHSTGQIAAGRFEFLRSALYSRRATVMAQFSEAVRSAVAAAKAKLSKLAARQARQEVVG